MRRMKQSLQLKDKILQKKIVKLDK